MFSKEVLRLENFKLGYKVREGYLSAVNDVSFSINNGEIFALVGESGCGKSTVAFSIMQLLMEGNEKASGKILFEDKNLLECSSREMEKIRGKKIGMIFQNPLDSLNPVYTSGYQVEEALRLEKMTKAEAKKKTLELLQKVKIPDAERRMASFPNELSGGMRQRVMIAMMLSRNPKLLIADEPTTALDVTVEAQILKIMKEFCKQLGSSILLITHNFGIVAEIADRIGIMYAGEIVEQGDVKELFTNPKHPYSQALLHSLPRQRKTEGRIETIDGSVPRIIGESIGCRFANRCKYATELCKKEQPPVVEVVEGHFVRCFREDD